MDERWLTVEDIRGYLNASNETIYKWIEQRKTPAHRVGRVGCLRSFRQDQKAAHRAAFVVSGGLESRGREAVRFDEVAPSGQPPALLLKRIECGDCLTLRRESAA